jgi:hypothetical protein
MWKFKLSKAHALLFAFLLTTASVAFNGKEVSAVTQKKTILPIVASAEYSLSLPLSQFIDAPDQNVDIDLVTTGGAATGVTLTSLVTEVFNQPVTAIKILEKLNPLNKELTLSMTVCTMSRWVTKTTTELEFVLTTWLP